MKGYHSILVSFLVLNKRINNKIALLWTPNDDTITSRIIHFNLNVYLFNVCVLECVCAAGICSAHRRGIRSRVTIFEHNPGSLQGH